MLIAMYFGKAGYFLITGNIVTTVQPHLLVWHIVTTLPLVGHKGSLLTLSNIIIIICVTDKTSIPLMLIMHPCIKLCHFYKNKKLLSDYSA